MSPNRKNIENFGRKRRPGYVRVFRETVGGRSLVRVLWAEPNIGPKMESFDDTRKGIAEAKAFACGVHDRLTGAAPVLAIAPITVRALHEKYAAAKETEWADNTLRLSIERWGKFELFVGRNADAASVTREQIDTLKKALLGKHSPNQVRHILKVVTKVYEWGVDRDLVPPTKLTNYRVKFARAVQRTAPVMAEYSRDERDRMAGTLDPRKGKEWRPWVLSIILDYCGPRVDAALRLELDDIELTPTTGRIHWRAETDKVGTDRFQPMPAPVVEALWVAMGWRRFDEYDGRFVFYGGQRRTRAHALRRNTRREKAKESLAGLVVNEKPWTYSAFNAWIRVAETRAGIAHIKFRGAHGKRRGIAGDVFDATESEKAAAEWIGDKSVRVVRDRYLLGRNERLQRTAALVSGVSGPDVNRDIPQSARSSSGAVLSEATENQPLTGEPAVGIEPTTARLHNT